MTLIDVCGFFFHDTPQYEPQPDLQAFLSSGPPPLYIGFGSIVLEDPKGTTAIILDAVNSAGVRAVISKAGRIWAKHIPLTYSSSETALMSGFPKTWRL
jgi:UDP:flavonoid glycosyltransferase YjiC (YdhE family)